MTKKTKKLAILLAAIIATGSMFFASCNDDEQLTKKEISMQKMIENPMPDGWYVGYKGIGNNQVVEIKELIKDNKIVELWVDGEKKEVKARGFTHTYGKEYKTDKISWDEANKIAREKAFDIAADLHKEGWPCVSVIDMGNMNYGDPSHRYQIIYSDEVPCD
ncbi:MAG: hypothetical protein II878_06555 [Bacteroidales bacterium]|nr:hypothetical protein [Bacteroidales bacterium]